jgi:hypothetical protein
MILVYSRIGKQLNQDGGTLRLKQILELDEYVRIKTDDLGTHLNFWKLLGFVFYIIKIKYYFLLRKPQIIVSSFTKYYDYFKKKRPIIDYFVTDDTLTSNSIIIVIAKYAGIKTVVYPHNLESLVPTQISPFTGKKSPDWFREEVNLLKISDTVHVISREEQWILKCLGLNDVRFLEYKSQLEDAFVNSVITERSISIKNNFLILGTAYNPPTKIGMEKLIEFLDSQSLDSQISVIGGGTEELFSKVKNSKIKILGFLPDDEIINYYKTAKACLIYQIPTSGALTKIPELLRMNIPVITNEMGNRSYWNLNSIYTYNNFEELIKIMTKF